MDFAGPKENRRDQKQALRSMRPRMICCEMVETNREMLHEPPGIGINERSSTTPPAAAILIVVIELSLSVAGSPNLGIMFLQPHTGVFWNLLCVLY